MFLPAFAQQFLVFPAIHVFEVAVLSEDQRALVVAKHRDSSTVVGLDGGTLELELAQAQERDALALSQLAVLAGEPPGWAADLVPPDGAATGDTLKLLLQTFAIMGKSINRFELRDADVVLRPPLLGVSSADFTSRVRAIRSGRDTALAQLPEIKAKLAALAR